MNDALRPSSSAPAADNHSEQVPLRRAELWLIFAFWTFIALLTTANAFLDPRGRGLQPVPPTAPAALAFIESYMWALLTPFIFRLAARSGPERARWVPRVVLLLALGVVVAILIDGFTGYLRSQLFYPPRRPLPELGPVFRVTRLWFVNEFIVYVAVLAAGFARVYFLRYRARQEEAIRLQAHAAQLQAQLSGARLAALRTQLNPHFLFNTLHAVSALVERDPRGVRRMIARLSELLRMTLEGGEEPEVPLEEELAFLQRYLEIMQIRFQESLEVETRIDPAALPALVPNLILQPLVENAIKHGTSRAEHTGRIEIEARVQRNDLVLSVRDNGPAPVGDKPPADEGFGLRNTRERLAQLYGAQQSLSLRPAEGGGMIAEVRLPFHTRADLHAAGVALGA